MDNHINILSFCFVFRAIEITPYISQKETLRLGIKRLGICKSVQKVESETPGKNGNVRFMTDSSKYFMQMSPKTQLVSTF